MNQARHGAILPCFSAHVHQQVLEGWHSPAFHSNDSFGFKHKPTTSISILCSVTVGCARQYVASSHLLGIHSIPFAHCSYSEQYRETVGSVVSPHRGHRGSHLKVLSSLLCPSAPRHQDLDSPFSSASPPALPPAVSSPGAEECGKQERPEVSPTERWGIPHLLLFTPLSPHAACSPLSHVKLYLPCIHLATPSTRSKHTVLTQRT